MGWLAMSCASDSKPEPAALPPTQTLTNGALQVAVDTLVGGRISSFSYAGKEILKTERDASNWQWGSTVWLSPQIAWGWPPHPTFDTAPYSATRPDAQTLVLTSGVDPQTRLQLEKQLVLGDTALALTFRLYNRGDTLRRYGLWSNTRLPYAGELVFAPGDSIRVEKIDNPVMGNASVALIRFDDQHPRNGKVFSELTEGAVHYIRDGLRFTQTTPYRTLGDVAPDQAPLEVYLAPEDGFAEFELQGPYGDLLPGGEPLVFELHWTLQPLN